MQKRLNPLGWCRAHPHNFYYFLNRLLSDRCHLQGLPAGWLNVLLISFSQVCWQNSGKVDRLHEADSSVLLLGSDSQLAVSAQMGLAGLQGVLGRSVCQSSVVLLVYSLCTYPFATYLTVQNSKQVGASILMEISGITLY